MATLTRRSLLSLPFAIPFFSRMIKPTPAQISSEQTHYDTIIIGAGAAGLAAARSLQDANRSVLILEARDRIGGRVQTNYDFAPHPVECGAEYIHGENVLTWKWVRRFGLKTLPVFAQDKNQFMYVNQKLLPFSQWSTLPGMEMLDLMNDSSIDELLTQWTNSKKPDISLAQLLSAQQIFLSPDIHRIVNHFLSGAYAANLDQLGVYGLVELTNEGDGDHNFRLKEGYSHFFDRFATGLKIQTSTPVKKIRWSATGATVETETNQTYTAKQIIITLPLALLQSEAVEFEPKLPDTKLSAIHGLGSGHITKLILKFDQPFWSNQLELCSTTLDSQMWWRPGWKRNNEAPILTAFTGADGADRLSKLGREKTIQLGLSDLEQMFDVQLRDRLIDALFVDWQSDPYSKMAYSYVPVNGVGLRSQLAQPIDRVLFFAGEATHPTRAATVHGAFESGIRAAEEILSIKNSRIS
ncbi:putative flavin-containing amine oxidase [Leptolyngbya sp. NIES-3755]|nr:putative flavin-containing amine oxidase [Leptolyngbya sp. NIES-3755]